MHHIVSHDDKYMDAEFEYATGLYMDCHLNGRDRSLKLEMLSTQLQLIVYMYV